MKKILLFAFILANLTAHSQPSNSRKAAPATVSANAEQLLGKWQISRILTPKLVEMPSEKTAGSYFIFAEDHSYQTMILGVAEKGTWQFGVENHSLQLLSKGMKTIWNILGINQNQLVIQKGTRGNTVTFIR